MVSIVNFPAGVVEIYVGRTINCILDFTGGIVNASAESWGNLRFHGRRKGIKKRKAGKSASCATNLVIC